MIKAHHSALFPKLFVVSVYVVKKTTVAVKQLMSIPLVQQSPTNSPSQMKVIRLNIGIAQTHGKKWFAVISMVVWSVIICKNCKPKSMYVKVNTIEISVAHLKSWRIVEESMVQSSAPWYSALSASPAFASPSIK